MKEDLEGRGVEADQMRKTGGEKRKVLKKEDIVHHLRKMKENKRKGKGHHLQDLFLQNLLNRQVFLMLDSINKKKKMNDKLILINS